MSLTGNFDYCVQLSLLATRTIFHLALKNEALFPHNIGPLPRDFGGHAASVSLRLLDDADAPADLDFADTKHLRFTLPVEITVEVPDAPDPALSRVTLRAAIRVPGALATWAVDGADQLGVDFAGTAAAAVEVPAIAGLPALDAARFAAALHTAYDAMPEHVFTQAGNTLVLYDGTRDPGLDPPPGPGSPGITTAIEPRGAEQYLRVTLPIHATVPAAVFASYGTATFWRRIVLGAGTVSVAMGTEPADPALATQIAFATPHPAAGLVASQLRPLLVARLAGFGTVTEPWFDEAAAKALLAAETAAYLDGRRFPMYTPRSDDPAHPVATPVGMLRPAEGILAILLNRNDASVPDQLPDAFLGPRDLALAVSRRLLDATIRDAMNEQFPGVNAGGAEVSTDEGDATLKTLSVTPSDPGEHDQAEGHLWASGEAEVHIDCWPDPDVSFDGPIFLRVAVTETEESCDLEIRPEMGEFDAGQSCCDVFVDLIIPVVGWIMLGVIEGMIDEVGGELAAEFAGQQAREVQAIPPVVVGVAELQACLEDIRVSRGGLVFPGKLRIRREGTSFEDLAATGDLPRP